MDSTVFDRLRTILRAKADLPYAGPFLVPEFLLGGSSARRLADAGNPWRFFLRVCDDIAGFGGMPVSSRELSEDDCVYLSFIRTFAALDGRIGTALTQLAFLPFLRRRLGVSVFLSLPTGVIGRTNRKGERGSPFAVRDPFDVDPSLADPLLPELSAVEQYQALVEACRLLGMRAGSVVAPATLAVDSPWFQRYPELGFWWRARPGEDWCLADPGDARTDPCTEPWLELSPATRDRFVPPPAEVTTALVDGQHHFVAAGETVSLANAFPGRYDEEGTLIWRDVAMLNFTTLKHPLPAGTASSRLDDPGRPAWSLAREMIAWRRNVLGEEVFLLDISGSLPDGVVKLIRDGCDGEVVLIGEQVWRFDRFSPALDAVAGPLVFCVSAHTRNLDKLVESLDYHLTLLESRDDGNPFLAGVANHDTMPPMPDLVPLLYLSYALLPAAVPFVFSGNEFHAQVVTNAEFGFTTPELRTRRAALTDDVVGLFNDRPLDWTGLPDRDERGRPLADLGDLLHRRSRLRAALPDLVGYRVLRLPVEDAGTYGLGYHRWSRSQDGVVVLANWHPSRPLRFAWPFADASVEIGVNADAVPRSVAPGELVTMPPWSAAVWLTGCQSRRNAGGT
ncbi:MAG TPA: hypothetical protein VHC18_15370 [Amycolatopsis sp.]|nr:hypothetical protein [Amycolatopsis sp.]